MNNTQRSLLAIYIPLTILVLIFDNIFPCEKMVQYLRYTIMITLFLSSVAIRKKFHEQKLMALSLFFVVVADFFLVFSTTIDKFKINLSIFGVIGFLIAYICLILAYQKNFQGIRKAEIQVLMLILIIFLIVCISLYSYVRGFMLIGALIFGLVLCYMTWTSICAMFRKYYNKKIAIIIAISGTLMFICDIGVAYSLFHPFYSTVYIPVLKNIVWMAYIMGWTLLDIVISEEKDLKVRI